jgi:predicted aspartyl protease
VPGRTWVTGPDVALTLYAGDADTPAENLSGIIDTGASVICVDGRVVKRLGLVASNKKPVQMADGRIETATIYSARMVIAALGFDDIVQVYALEMKSTTPISRVLIGRSFLSNYIVNYDGPRERFEFHETDRGADFYYIDHDE